MSQIVNRRDLDFVMYEMLHVERLFSAKRYSAYDREAVTQIFDTAQAMAEEIFQPIAALVDAQEPDFVKGKAIVPPQTAQALHAFADAGFFALPFDEEAGGLQAPWFVHTAVGGMFTAANTSVTNYAFLTIAAANLLFEFGSEELKKRVLPRMLAGEWFGTMCLSEPQAGSSLADIRTTATDAGDGLYSIRGSKMWISGGDQDITDNIIHMVLARLPGGPPGTKGLSLFMVPKQQINDDGSMGASNNVRLAGLNHKLGQRGTTNCLLNFGEGGATLGYMIGEPNSGIECMFHMMNEARIGVGHASVMAALAGYLHSADYARNRLQGRRVDQRDPNSPQVPIVEHVDVRRMLMAQKSAVEGAQALCFYCAMLVDQLTVEPNAGRRADLTSLLGLLTPVVKAWPSEHCLEANKWAIQILGGYGYTNDHPVERLYRDNRLNHIHEGTFGIQGLDLLGRKVTADDGVTLNRLTAIIRATISEAANEPLLTEDRVDLTKLVDALEFTTETLLGCKDVALRTANATIYLDAFGHVVIGWLWLWQARIAAQALSNPLSDGERAFYEGKLRACRYFTRHQLPLAHARFDLCASLDDSCLSSCEADFG
ncbi:acyl-CoA dehydrogenase [Tianweitania sp. Rool2]|uniref:3-methylmercaptopropionyl-CoA dehydrogenase n=2 Tax=Oryzicola mucosus TaxID=2767425 RepID=A0A8J6PQG3_9HYPH|nr:acyl-CoA dehydrogenase [Oryzicola mucosus]